MDMLSNNLTDKFEKVLQEYTELEDFLCSVEIMSDNKLFEFYRRKKSKLEPLAKAVKEWNTANEELAVAKELLSLEENVDEKMALKQKVEELEEKTEQKLEQAKQVFQNQNTFGEQTAKVEISYKSGENILEFLSGVFEKFADETFSHFEIIKKEIESIWIVISGEGVFEKLKHFSGLIKKTESGKESTALCVVLNDNKCEIEFDEKDVEVQTSRSGGAGGQHINKTESAVRLVHTPTGIVAECQDERSQLKNKEKAMQALKQKILQKQAENNEKYIKNQRNELKNAIFSNSTVLEFDFDKNEACHIKTKVHFKLKEILEGNLSKIVREIN